MRGGGCLRATPARHDNKTSGRTDASRANLNEMNTPNPLVPQGTFADKGKHHIRITVFAILAVHVVLLGVLLIAGCDKKNPTAAGTDPNLPAQPTQPLPDPVWPPVPTPAPTTGVAATINTGLPPAGYPPAGLVPVNPPGSLTPPGPGPTPGGNVVDVPVPPSTTEHAVVKGDSFSTLGKRYKVGYKAIAEANPGVDSTRLKLGQKLHIPAPKAPSGVSAPAGGGVAPAPSAGGEIIHSIKSGDNLWTLSRKYGVSEREIRSANNLRTSQLKVGQKLKIPGKAPPPVEATAPAPSLPPATPGIPEAAPRSSP